jgi:hypothetical protein
MVMPRKVPVDFDLVFPFGAYAVGEVKRVKDYDRSTAEVPAYATDPDTELPVWTVDVVDADPEAKKSNRTVSVKVAARVQPVLPEAAEGMPFRPIEFEKMTATAYIEETDNFSRLAWSFRAGSLREPSRGVKPAAPKVSSDKAVA